MAKSTPPALTECAADAVTTLCPAALDHRVSTDNVAEAFRVVQEFCDQCTKEPGERQLRLTLRTPSCSELFKQSIYSALHEQLDHCLSGTSARWSLPVNLKAPSFRAG